MAKRTKLVRVRVLPGRALTHDGERMGHGSVIELDVKQARPLVEAGHVASWSDMESYDAHDPGQDLTFDDDIHTTDVTDPDEGESEGKETGEKT